MRQMRKNEDLKIYSSFLYTILLLLIWFVLFMFEELIKLSSKNTTTKR